MVVDNGRRSYFTAVAHGVQPNAVRQSNQRAVLTAVSSSPGLSNAEISRRTRLAPQSVSSVLLELEAQGLVRRGQARHDGGRGQPATPIYINAEGAFSLGVEIGWTRLEVALTDFSARVVARQRHQHEFPLADEVIDEVMKMIAAVTAPLGEDARKRIIGITLAVPHGIADPLSLMSAPAGEAERWARFDPAAELERATGYSVETMGDGNAACWGEFVAHPSPRPGNFAYLLVDRFLVGGIVTEDRLSEGKTGRSGKFGAMLATDRDGRRRFAQEIASLHALEKRLVAAGLSPDAINQPLAPNAEAVVGPWIEEVGAVLAEVVVNIEAVLEVEFAVIDAELPVDLLERVLVATSAKLGETPRPGLTAPLVRRGHLGRSGAAQGAALRRMYLRYYSRELEHLDTD